MVDEILPILNERGLYLEAQCCEHLNRALIMERAAAENSVMRSSASARAQSGRLVCNGCL